MTCAPRGIFRTKSANRGRNAVSTMPFDGRDPGALGLTDQLVVCEGPRVRVVRRPAVQLEEVGPVALVDEQGVFPGLERLPASVQA